ncbi:hypothetical protein MMC13_002661 [Lambiella insularis]|nr:hypothetical protein [Lambiella insularis]
MALSLAGKTAIVTGAGSGINQPADYIIYVGINLLFARLLLSKQCNVIFADLALRPEAKELVADHSSSSRAPAQAVFKKTDVREWSELVQSRRLTRHFFYLWSNFWSPPGAPPSKDPARSSRYALLDINLTHPIRTTQMVISHFLNLSDTTRRRPASSTNPASIIHISSIAGQVTPLAAPIYNATKHALNGFVRSLAPLDGHLGIRITAVAPGVIKTPLWTENPEKLRLVSDTDDWMVDLIEKEGIEVQASAVASTGLSSGDDRQGTKMVKVEGGFILEVGRKLRKVEMFNDSGPLREGDMASNIAVGDRDIFERLNKRGWGSLD